MICFDTQVLIWGVQSTGHEGREAIVERTRKYIGWLQKHKEQIMLPAPAVTEYLVGFEPDEQQRQLHAIERALLVAAFDMPAAAMAARILGRRLDMEKIARDHSLRRQKLKVDAFIVATAIIQNVESLVSNDPHMKKLAGGSSLKVIEVPEITEQGLLFGSDQV
jgi:predicted nucleic acid-binding protein